MVYKILMLFLIISCRTSDPSTGKEKTENIPNKSTVTDFKEIIKKIEDTRIIRPQDIQIHFRIEEKTYENDIKASRIKFGKLDLESDYIEIEICKHTEECTSMPSYSRTFFLDLDKGLYKLRARACVSFGHSETNQPFCSPFWTDWQTLEQTSELSDEIKAKIQNENTVNFSFLKMSEDFYQKVITLEAEMQNCKDATEEDKKRMSDLRKVPAVNWAQMIVNDVFTSINPHMSSLSLTNPSASMPEHELNMIRAYTPVLNILESLDNANNLENIKSRSSEKARAGSSLRLYKSLNAYELAKKLENPKSGLRTLKPQHRIAAKIRLIMKDEILKAEMQQSIGNFLKELQKFVDENKAFETQSGLRLITQYQKQLQYYVRLGLIQDHSLIYSLEKKQIRVAPVLREATSQGNEFLQRFELNQMTDEALKAEEIDEISTKPIPPPPLPRQQQPAQIAAKKQPEIQQQQPDLSLKKKPSTFGPAIGLITITTALLGAAGAAVANIGLTTDVSCARGVWEKLKIGEVK